MLKCVNFAYKNYDYFAYKKQHIVDELKFDQVWFLNVKKNEELVRVSYHLSSPSNGMLMGNGFESSKGEFVCIIWIF